MKKRIVLMLFLVSVAISAFALNDPFTLGFVAMATPSLSLTSAAPTIVGLMPNNTHTLTVFADVDTNYGPSTVSSGTGSPFIAAGTSKDFEHIVSANPTIYLIPRALATATIRLRAR